MLLKGESSNILNFTSGSCKPNQAQNKKERHKKGGRGATINYSPLVTYEWCNIQIYLRAFKFALLNSSNLHANSKRKFPIFNSKFADA